METLEKQAVRLMVYRMVVVFTFFITSLGVQAFLGLEFYLKPFYQLVAFVLALNLLYTIIYVSLRTWRGRPVFIYVQLLGDILSVTLLALFTGGLNSIFTFLYHVLVVVGGYLLKRRGAFLVASMDCLLYGFLCVALFYGWLDPERLGSNYPYDPPTAGSALYALLAHYVGFFLIAILMTIMSGRIESTRAALGVMEKDFSLLRTLNEKIVSSLTWGVITMEETGRVTFANPAAMRLLGETLPSGWNFNHKLEALGQPVINLFVPDGYREKSLELHLSGERHLEILVTELVSGESPLGFLALIRDQTEIVRLREQLALKDRLMATGAMAADIAHEIRNPLGSISGAAQMLQRQSPEAASQHALLGIIQDESRRLTEILNNFLRYVKPPPAKKHLLGVTSLVSEVVALFRNDPACAGALHVETDLPSEEIEVNIDPDRVRQALWNLLSNARKAIGENGTIKVRLALEGENVILDVTDDGVGMRPSEIANYFQPFRRGFSQGSGLGLSVVYQIMEQHGGRIEITSSPGKGTRCRLVFPLEASA